MAQAPPFAGFYSSRFRRCLRGQENATALFLPVLAA